MPASERVDSEEIWDIDLAGQPLAITLALDEARLRDAYGSGDYYSNWTLSSVRNWGELSTGIWTLKVADLSSTGNSTGGTLTAASLKLFDSPGTPVNPAPVALITQPTAGQRFSPGTTINVEISATDLTVGVTTGTVTQVELFDNDVSIGIDTAGPYLFSVAPAIGSHSLVVKATDCGSAIGTSVSVAFSVVNQAPIITAATLSATSQGYSDVPLTASDGSSSTSDQRIFVRLTVAQ